MNDAYKKTRVTIYEVAKHAGVSLATVSRVINDSPSVSDATKDKVRFWQKTQRTLLKNKPYLERDYDRESNEILVNDLGYRFKRLTEK